MEDEDFYKSAIKTIRMYNGVLRFFVCNGKQNVLDVREKLRMEIDKKFDVLFFVDNDLDPVLGNEAAIGPKTSVTKWCSIESYVCSEQFLDMFLSEFLKVREWDVNTSSSLSAT